MTIAPQSLRSMRDELEKLAAVPEERLTPSRKKQMLRDAPVAIGSMGLGWGLGKTLGDSIAKRSLKNPKSLAKARKYVPPLMAVGATGLGLVLSKQRRELKQRRDQAEKAAKKKQLKKPKKVAK